MGTLLQDIRYGLRMLARNPGFTAVAVLTLALGIGASTAIFSLVNTFILNPVPLESGSRLLEINEIDQAHNKMWRVSPQLYHDLEGHPEIIEKMASFRYDVSHISGDEFVKRVFGCQVTPSFFEIFSIQPALGRVFHKDEGRPEDDGVVIISHSLWKSQFAGNAEVIGQKLKTDDKTFIVVGVMPPHFQFPSRYTLYWRPFRFTSKMVAGRLGGRANWWAIARLRTGVSREKAQAFLDAVNQRLALDFPGIRENRIIRARPLRGFFVGPEVRKTLWTLTGAIAFVLLIACANLANLQLARTESRLREVTVRMALGAGRWRIVRQLLTGSVLLSSVGGFGGVLIAVWAVKIPSLLVPSFSPLVRPVGVDRAMLLCALGLSFATGIAFGLFPALYASCFRLSESLKESGPMTSASSGHRLFRNALVVGEVALAFVLLGAAGLMIQSLVHVLRVNPGYNPKNVARINLTTRAGERVDFERRRSQFPAFAERLAALPGTTAVGLMGSSASQDWQVQGKAEPVRLRTVQVGVGSHDCFRALRVPLREGRFFHETDAAEGQTSIIVNESLARLCWPQVSAVGKRIWSSSGVDTSVRIVAGVVADHKEWGYEQEAKPTVYEPFERRPGGSVYFLVRTSLDPASLAQAVRRDVKEIVPDVYAPSIDWLEQTLWASTYSRRLYMDFLCAFGAAGLFLSALGIYGILSYIVARRTHEIGVRMALGAQPRDILRLVITKGLILVVVGLVVGTMGALVLTRVMSSLLYGVTPTDPMTFVAVSLLLTMVSLIACYIPARRAAKIDPMVALRYE